MGLREKINQNPLVGVSVCVLCIGAAAGGVWYSMKPVSNALPNKSFFTVDDGVTLFSDDANKQTPFQRDGKEAVKAYVYSCDEGKTQFVAYLEKMPPGTPPAPADAAPTPPKPEAGGRQMAPSRPMGPVVRPGAFAAMVKKPGDKDWLRPGEAKYFATISAKCTDGSAKLDRVFP